VRDSAKDAAANVAGTAKEQAVQVAGEAKTQARDLLRQGRTELTDQARNQQQRAASSLHALSSQLHNMSANASEPGLAQDLTGQVASHAGTLASWLEDREPGAVLDEVRQYAHRKPATFLALCAGAGILAGRLGRGMQADASGSADSADSTGTANSQHIDADAQMTRTPSEGPDPSVGRASGTATGTPAPTGHGYATPGQPGTADVSVADADWATQGGRP
jgi:hypothetical protein